MDTADEIRYFCNPLLDGRFMVVAIGTVEDVYDLTGRLPHWTLACTKKYFDTIPSDKIIWFQQEFDFD